MAKVTLTDLSQQTGYSIATISRVLSGKGYVKEDTRQKIMSAVQRAGYRLGNPAETEGNPNKLVVIMGDLDNWYYMETYRFIDQLAVENGYQSEILYSANDKQREKELVQRAIEAKVGGIFFFNVRNDSELSSILADTSIPVVFLNRSLKYGYCNTVCNDNYHGGYQAALYLISKGHKRIGHLMGSAFSATANDRRRGFEDAMKDNGCEITVNTVYQGDLNWESGYRYGEYIIKNGLDITAIFSSGYEMTEGLIDFFQENGIRIPEDISLISFDETPSMRRADITTICASAEKMGRRAMELLMKNPTETETIHLRPDLIIRNSVRTIL